MLVHLQAAQPAGFQPDARTQAAPADDVCRRHPCRAAGRHGHQVHLVRARVIARAHQPDGPALTTRPAPCRHAVGTQNYSSLSSTQYGNNQGFARLFKGQTNALISIHYFNSQGQPVFNQARPLRLRWWASEDRPQ